MLMKFNVFKTRIFTICVVSFLVITYLPTFSLADEQLEPILKPLVYNSAVIREEPSGSSFGLSIIETKLIVDFMDPDTDETVEFMPNNAVMVGAYLKHSNSVYSIEMPDYSEISVEEGRGDSDYLSLEFQHAWDPDNTGIPIEMSLYYNWSRGYYIYNQTDASGNYFVFPDMEVTNYGMGFVFYPYKYKFKDKRKFLSAQKRDHLGKGATVIGLAQIDYVEMDGLPSDPAVLSQIDLSELIVIESAKMVSLGVGGAGVGFLSYNRVFLEAGFGGVVGLADVEYEKLGVKDRNTDMLISLYMQGDIGWHFDDSAFGIHGDISSNGWEIDDVSVGSSVSKTALYYKHFF